MSKFCGAIGYVTQIETTPGVWEDQITEKTYHGDVVRNNRRWDIAEKLNDDLQVENNISIIGDTFLYSNFSAIRYVTWLGTRWKITKVELNRPRLSLTLGGVYNGPTA